MQTRLNNSKLHEFQLWVTFQLLGASRLLPQSVNGPLELCIHSWVKEHQAWQRSIAERGVKGLTAKQQAKYERWYAQPLRQFTLQVDSSGAKSTHGCKMVEARMDMEPDQLAIRVKGDFRQTVPGRRGFSRCAASGPGLAAGLARRSSALGARAQGGPCRSGCGRGPFACCGGAVCLGHSLSQLREKGVVQQRWAGAAVPPRICGVCHLSSSSRRQGRIKVRVLERKRIGS